MTGLLLLAGLALAQEDEPLVQVRPSGHVKSFAVATFPYDHVLMPDAPMAQAYLDARLNLGVDVGQVFRFEVAHAVTAFIGQSQSSSMSFTGTGVGLQAPEVVDLTWTAFDQDMCDTLEELAEDEDYSCTASDTLTLRGRTDRLLARFTLPGLDVTVGRQPITFGNGLFFTPLDLVAPFTPAVIDTEYKPGVDAVRVDVYPTFSSKITVAAAYAGDWDWRGLALALYGQATVGVTDVGLFLGEVRATHVIGATTVSSIGPVGIRADAAVSIPHEERDEDPFFRGTVGADWRPTDTTTLSGEFYLQTLGDTDPNELLVTMTGERFTDGEVWLGGIAYLGLSVSQEITPTLFASVGIFGNLTDPSAFVAPSLSWSIAANADLAFGGYFGLGERPDEVDVLDLVGLSEDDALRALGINSEFGFYPGVMFLQVRTYF